MISPRAAFALSPVPNVCQSGATTATTSQPSPLQDQQQAMDDSEVVPQPLDTPPISRVPSYIQFAPRRAMASFENLVALANYEERLREARKIVWRDRGEKPVELDNLWECFEHGGRGGLSTFPLPAAHGLRDEQRWFQELARWRLPSGRESTLFSL
jgi:hypothetical protein